MARGAEEVRRQAEAAPSPVEVAAWVADWSGMPPAAPAPETMAAPGGRARIARPVPVVTAGARPVETMTARPVAPPARTTAMTPAPVTPVRTATGQTAARPAEAARSAVTPLFAEAIRTRPMDPASRPVAPAVNRPALMSSAVHLPPNHVDDETLRHIADFEAALATLTDTLEEARALDGGKTGGNVASGD